MSQPAPAHDDSYVLTLEEIGNLAAEGGKAGRNLDECGRSDCQALSDRSLFGVFAGTGSRQPGSGSDRRTSSAVHRHAAHGLHEGLDRIGRRTGAPGCRRACQQASALQIFQRSW